MNSDYHKEPRLLLYNGGTDRYIGIWDVHLHLLVLPCPVNTANRQLQQPIPEKSKTTSSSDPSGMIVFLEHPAKQENYTHQVLTKKNLERVIEDKKKNQSSPYDPLQWQGLMLVLTH